MTRRGDRSTHARFRPALAGPADLVGRRRNRAALEIARQDRPLAHRARSRSTAPPAPSCPWLNDGTPLGLASMYDDYAEAADLARVTAVAPAESAARGGSSPLARALPMQQCAGLAHILHQADWIAGQFSGRFDVTDENNALEDRGTIRSSRQWPAWIAAAGFDCEVSALGRPRRYARRDHHRRSRRQVRSAGR